jgi:hypothetical protein
MMFSISEFSRILSIEHNLIHTQTEGLSQADTLILPQPGGNCMNWVLGHTLENQVTVLELLGGKSPIDASSLEIYRRESNRLTGTDPHVLTLETLLDGHDRLHAAVIARLGEMNDADFTREIIHAERTVTLGWRILFLNFHYNYHIGQLELLRQLAGRIEKLI